MGALVHSVRNHHHKRVSLAHGKQKRPALRTLYSYRLVIEFTDFSKPLQQGSIHVQEPNDPQKIHGRAAIL